MAKDEIKNSTTPVEEDGSKPEKWLAYYADSIYEDEEHLQMVGETANRILFDRFHITIESYKMTTVIFLKTCEVIMDKLKKLITEYNEFTINICDRVSFGFSNNENEDDEKAGNFMVFMKHLKDSPRLEKSDDITMSNMERVVQFNSENIKAQPELIRGISVDTVKYLRDVDIQLSNSELIIPIFVTYYESLVSYVKIKRKEEDSFDFEMNLVTMTVGSREGESGEDVIYIRPSIESKLALKNDASASAVNE